MFQTSPYDINSPTDSVIGADFQVTTVCPKKSWPILYSKLQYIMGNYLFDTK